MFGAGVVRLRFEAGCEVGCRSREARFGAAFDSGGFVRTLPGCISGSFGALLRVHFGFRFGRRKVRMKAVRRKRSVYRSASGFFGIGVFGRGCPCRSLGIVGFRTRLRRPLRAAGGWKTFRWRMAAAAFQLRAGLPSGCFSSGRAWAVTGRFLAVVWSGAESRAVCLNCGRDPKIYAAYP